ncbi:hypothetical protein HDZ31DRAFT_75248 [Schizophyllum fasciatum]
MSSRRAAAQRAQASIAAQADSDSDTDDAGDSESPRKVAPKSQAKGKGRARRKSLAEVSGSSFSLHATHPALPPKSASARRPPRPPKSGAKRERSPAGSSLTDADSDLELTSLSSSPHSSFAPGKMMLSKAPWTLEAIRQYAWVLIDLDGHAVDGEVLASDRGIWWPAKVVSRSSDSLTAQLYGDHHREPHITILSPSSSNIMPFLSDLQTIPFEPVPWVISSVPSLPTSPRKRRKTNINLDDVQEAWYSAADSALKHYVEKECDDFPPPSLVSHVLYQRSNHIGSISDDDLEPSTLKLKESLENYESYSLGTEPVLAQDKGYYWPARILNMYRPTDNQRAVRFRIEYCDRSEKTVTKKQFYDQTEPEFLTCKLGTIDSGQEEPDDETTRQSTLEAERSRSPEPSDPPPTSTEFCALDLREQWVYTKPVLQAILRDEYAPAKEQNFIFFASDSGRKHLTEKASAQGTLTPKEVVRLRDYILEWCLRDAKHATRIEDEGIDVIAQAAEAEQEAGPPPSSQLDEEPLSRPSSAAPPPPSTAPSEPGDDQKPSDATSDVDTEMDITETQTRPSPQRGSEAYELLSPLERLEYCMNILLPAAVQQLLLWRSGDRRSTALLPPEDEARLYKLGVQKSKEQDWVVAILEYRRFAGKEKPTAPKRRQSVSEEPVFSASGRPKRQVRKGQSFRL